MLQEQTGVNYQREETKMPKANLYSDPIEDKINQIRNQIRPLIAAAEAQRHIPRAETIRHSGMSPANFYKAWRDPALFRVGQLIRIYDFLKVPEAERWFV